MTVPILQVTRVLSFVTLALEISAFVPQSLHSESFMLFNTPTFTPSRMQTALISPHRAVRTRPLHRPCSPPPFTPGEWVPRTTLLTAMEAGEAVEGVGAQVPVQGDGGDDNSLESAFGAGKGKHAGKQRRRHTNKYSSKSKAAEIDPWEEQVQKAEETLGEVEARARLELQELEERRVQRRIERGEVEYPDEEDIDPYDPSTFGYIEHTMIEQRLVVEGGHVPEDPEPVKPPKALKPAKVGQIQGAHGVKGEVKVRSSTDFAVKRLCTPGVKYIKAPNRRFPRDIELIGGRWQKEGIFLLHFEGITSRDAAASLRGHQVYVLEDEEVDLAENEYMVRDIVGARAYSVDAEALFLGEVVGVVLGDDISSTVGLASDMLELRLPLDNPYDKPKQCYIPFVPAIVPVVRMNEGNCTVLMDLPEGLLDLAVEVEEKVVIRGFLPG